MAENLGQIDVVVKSDNQQIRMPAAAANVGAMGQAPSFFGPPKPASLAGGGAAQTAITSLGTLTTLTVDNVIINGTTIGHTDDTDLITLADGALTVAGTLAPSGVLTANAGVVVDNITIDGTEIDLSSGDLTLDVAGDIILDADGADVKFSDGGTHIGTFTNSSSDFVITSAVQDKDIVFKGDDNGAAITALTLDMSDAGAATFNNKIVATELDISGNVDIDGILETDNLTVGGAQGSD